MKKIYLSFCMLFFVSGAFAMKLESAAFYEGGIIPQLYGCVSKDISPPLAWQEAPKNTQSFVLIMHDPDAVSGQWTHWVVFNIPAGTHAFAENMTKSPEPIKLGQNSWKTNTYGGPCPPTGVHRYFFELYALDTLLNLSMGATKQQIETAMQGHILASTSLMGRYSK